MCLWYSDFEMKVGDPGIALFFSNMEIDCHPVVALADEFQTPIETLETYAYNPRSLI